jgi:tetratricopeptide (TPR) repeat protein
MLRTCPILLVLLLAGSALLAQEQVTPEKRIRYYRAKVKASPINYPAWALLAAAHLDKMKASADPAGVPQVETALERSLAIQPNLTAYKVAAALANYRHHFADALDWTQKAARTAPEDTEIVAMQVEALLALGRSDEARALLPPASTIPDDFYFAASLGQWAMAEERWNTAHAAFRRASELADEQDAPSFVLWAEVRASGALLDSGRAEAARDHLQRAARVDPTDVDLRIHRSEYLEALGRLDAAFDLVESITQERSDPSVHRRAWDLARALGREDAAKSHFEAAVTGFERIVQAGEVHSLDALARLYCDAGVELERGLRLARRNFEFKKDRSAREILECFETVPAHHKPS